MAPLIFLLGSFSLFFLINKTVLNERLSLAFIGRASMSVMLITTGVAHFTMTTMMTEMMPEFMPMKTEIIYATGVIELLAAVGLLIESTSKLTAVLLLVFFLCILPANIIGTLKEVQYSGMQYGAPYLIFRIPVQILYIAWAYYFGVRINKQAETRP